MKILIPLDGSRFAEQILESAARFARSCSAQVYLIEVIHGSSGSFRSQGSTGDPHAMGESIGAGLGSSGVAGSRAETQVQAEERLRQEAGDYLARVAAQHFPEGVQRQVVLGNDPAEEIIKYARSEEIDLIAIATHGRTGLARLMMGSVAGKLLQSHVAPLMMVHPDGLN